MGGTTGQVFVSRREDRQFGLRLVDKPLPEPQVVRPGFELSLDVGPDIPTDRLRGKNTLLAGTVEFVQQKIQRFRYAGLADLVWPLHHGYAGRSKCDLAVHYPAIVVEM